MTPATTRMLLLCVLVPFASGCGASTGVESPGRTDGAGGAGGIGGSSGAGGGSECQTDQACDVAAICEPCPDGSCRTQTPYCSQGICKAKLGTCAAPEACKAMAAKAVGPCNAVLGVAWNGGDCVLLSGCGCDGAACSKLFSDRLSCLMEFGECYSASSVRRGKACGSACQYCPPGADCPAALQACDGKGVCGGGQACQ